MQQVALFHLFRYYFLFELTLLVSMYCYMCTNFNAVVSGYIRLCYG